MNYEELIRKYELLQARTHERNEDIEFNGGYNAAVYCELKLLNMIVKDLREVNKR